MKSCACGSLAINHGIHGRDGSDPDLCDVCYWRKRAEELAKVLVDAELITRSKCREITGMTHEEIAKLMACSPIGRQVAQDCAEIARNWRGEDGISCSHRLDIAEKIEGEFGLNKGKGDAL